MPLGPRFSDKLTTEDDDAVKPVLFCFLGVNSKEDMDWMLSIVHNIDRC